MKKTNPFKVIITSILLTAVMFTNCTQATLAKEERATVTFKLSQELIDMGYRLAPKCDDKENVKQCFYINEQDPKTKTVVAVESYLADNKKVPAYPAVNTGKNYEPIDVEFRIGNEVVSYPDTSISYRPRPTASNMHKEWQAGTTFVAYLRTATVNYYDGAELLSSETFRAGDNPTEYTPNNIETETELKTFSKWIDEAGNDVQLTAVQLSTNVYAQYISTAKHLVSFVSGENEISSNRTLDGTSTTMNTIPTKDSTISEDADYNYTTDYTFSYWSVNGNEVNLDSYMITEDTTFTAIFNEVTTSTKKEVITPITPVAPVAPETPVSPVIPAAPIAPVTPATPVTPITPEAIVTPETPVALTTPVATQTATVTTQEVATVATPQVEQAQLETINEEATPLSNEVGQQETIANDETPLAKPVSITTSWSLINLLCMLATILLGIYAFLKNRKNVSTVFNKTSATFMFVASIATFFLTQDVMSTMSFVDGWTAVMAIILAVQCVIVCVRKQESQEK